MLPPADDGLLADRGSPTLQERDPRVRLERPRRFRRVRNRKSSDVIGHGRRPGAGRRGAALASSPHSAPTYSSRSGKAAGRPTGGKAVNQRTTPPSGRNRESATGSPTASHRPAGAHVARHVVGRERVRRQALAASSSGHPGPPTAKVTDDRDPLRSNTPISSRYASPRSEPVQRADRLCCPPPVNASPASRRSSAAAVSGSGTAMTRWSIPSKSVYALGQPARRSSATRPPSMTTTGRLGTLVSSRSHPLRASSTARRGLHPRLRVRWRHEPPRSARRPPVHRQPRGPRAPRHGSAGAADRLRARPAGHRPEGVAGRSSFATASAAWYAATIATIDSQALDAFGTPPALHRFPATWRSGPRPVLGHRGRVRR